MKRLLSLAVVLFALCAGCRSERAARQSPETPAKAEAAPKPARYAVLVNGDTERRHKDNIARAYATLSALGFAPDHIFIISTADKKSQWAKATIRLNPVPDNFWRVMDDLIPVVKKGDLILVYATGHGDIDQGDALLELRRGEVWPQDLREEVDRYQGDTIVVMDQCYSGGFADAFRGTRSRAIAISSVDARHVTDCTHFAQTFWDSFLRPELADRNHDGKTSVREAFDAALKAHRKELAGDMELSANGSYQSFNGFDDAVLR